MADAGTTTSVSAGTNHITFGCCQEDRALAETLAAGLTHRGFVVANVGFVASASQPRLATIKAGAVYLAVATSAFMQSKPCQKELRVALESSPPTGGVVVVTLHPDYRLSKRLQHLTPVVFDDEAQAAVEASPAFERVMQEVNKFNVGLQDAASVRPPTFRPGSGRSLTSAAAVSTGGDRPEFDPEEVAEVVHKLAHVAQLALQDDDGLGEFISTSGIQWVVANLELMYGLPVLATTACLAIVHLAARDEATARLCLEAGAVSAVCEAMECHRDHGVLQRLGVRALRLMALERKVLNEGCVQACLAAMRQYADDPMLVAEACRFVAAVSTQFQFGERGRELLIAADASALCRKAAQDLSAPTYVTDAGANAVRCLS